MVGDKSESTSPFLGSAGRSISLSLVGGVLLAITINAWNAPQTKSNDADERIEASLRELRGEVGRLRDRLVAHEAENAADRARFATVIEANTADRFSGSDWRREDRRLQERHDDTRREIARLDSQLAGIVDYLTEERRLQDND